MNRYRTVFILLALSATLLFGPVTGCSFSGSFQADVLTFNGQRALDDVYTQVAFGPRTHGSAAHAQFRDWLVDEINATGWDASIQQGELLGRSIYNIIATRSEAEPQIILGAHYDSRLVADHDPDPARQTEPVPGANDGASGVAVLLEIARTLPVDSVPVSLVFFDAEDDGDLPGSDWILGSRYFADNLKFSPQAVVIVDMIGDADLNIYYEGYSDDYLKETIWAQAAALGYQNAFIAQPKYTILDDHKPFIDRGIPAVDIIDIDYPYWHTTADTPDKVSAQSLQIVGDTLLAWLESLQE